MKKLPTISIVIPVFNAANTLDECLSSIKFQNYPSDKVEVIVVDGNSVDGTLAIASKYGATVLYNPDKIHPVGRVIGIAASKSDLILCLDADNFLESDDWLSLMVQPLIEDSSICWGIPVSFAGINIDAVGSGYSSRTRIPWEIL